MKKILKILPLTLAVVILYFLIYPNYENIVNVYKNSSRTYLLLSILSSFISYFFMSLSLYKMLEIMGYKIGFSSAFPITMISTTINYFFSSIGASGFALRMHLLSKKKVPVSISLTTSVVLTAFIYLTLGIILMQSFILYAIEIRRINIKIMEGFIGVFFIFLITFVMTLIIYNHRFRNRWAIRIYYFINSTIYQITKYQIPKADFRAFKNQLNHGINILHKRRYELPKVVVYIIFDWFFNIMVLYFGFLSAGVKVSIINLLIGFSFGIIMTIIPILPSGLGASEFVMASFYSNYDIPLEAALFASLVFRISYYLIPSVLSFIMFYGIKSIDTDGKKEEEKEAI